jgi:hypothetical protein
LCIATGSLTNSSILTVVNPREDGPYAFPNPEWRTISYVRECDVKNCARDGTSRAKGTRG